MLASRNREGGTTQCATVEEDMTGPSRPGLTWSHKRGEKAIPQFSSEFGVHGNQIRQLRVNQREGPQTPNAVGLLLYLDNGEGFKLL